MKRIELIELKSKLNQLNLTGYNKFALYSIDRTKAAIVEIENEVQTKDQERYTDEFVVFEKARVEQLKKYGKRDEENNIVITGNSVEIIEDKKEEFETVLASLREQYKDVIAEYVKASEELDKFINESVENVIIKFSFKHLPETMDEHEYLILSKFIKETPEEIASLM